MAITCQFAGFQVAQIAALGLLYTLNIVSIFYLQVVGFLIAGHI